MSKLKLASDLSLPLDAVTQTFAILAKRRAGKSYTMRRLVEQLFKAGQQVVLVDPKGDQWGIRSAADGKAPGLAIVILGGERGDVPLEASGGEVVAKLVVEERVSVLLDLSLFRKHEVATFMTAFLENLYRLKAREVYRTPMMLVIDEADAIAPQKPQKGEERMLGAAEDIVRRGGQRGIGCVLVTQRSAVLNKNVLTQAQMLVALRTIAPQDLEAMDAWIQVHGTPEQRKTLMESLPSLPVGDAWFWSPGWPTVDGIFKRVHVLPIETFDSGKSPEPGVKPVEPKHAADVDLDALKRQMAATIEKAKAEDPKELRKQLAAARQEVAQLQKFRAEVDERTKRIDAKLDRVKQTPALTDADRKLLERLNEQWKDTIVALADKADLMLQSIADRAKDALDATARAWVKDIERTRADFNAQVEKSSTQKVLAKLAVLQPTPDRPAMKSLQDVNRRYNEGWAIGKPHGSSSATHRRSAVLSAADVHEAAGNLPPARRKILNALAFLEGIGVLQADKTQVALLAEVSPSSGSYYNNLGALRSAGLVSYPGPSLLALTPEGRGLAETDGLPQSTGELHEALRRRLPPAKWKVLAALIDAHPEAVSKEALAERIGVSGSSGSYYNNLGSLRSLGLVDYPAPGAVVATQILFLDGR